MSKDEQKSDPGRELIGAILWTTLIITAATITTWGMEERERIRQSFLPDHEPKKDVPHKLLLRPEEKCDWFFESWFSDCH